MKTISLISLALCAVCIFADDNVAEIDSTPFILGGESAKQGQFPYQVSLRHAGGHFCSGAIVGEWFILTSAQCILNNHLQPKHINVVMGTTALFGTSLHVNEISVHPKYVEKHGYNDLALLRTAEKIPYSAYIQSIALPTFDTMFHGSDVLISGWGSLNSNGESGNLSELKFSRTNVLGLPICGMKHGRFIFNTNLCTKSQKVCTGDEGGPLVHEGKKSDKTLVGIVSSYNCGSDKPDIYTRVYSYRKWIKSEMDRLTPPRPTPTHKPTQEPNTTTEGTVTEPTGGSTEGPTGVSTEKPTGQTTKKPGNTTQAPPQPTTPKPGKNSASLIHMSPLLLLVCALFFI